MSFQKRRLTRLTSKARRKMRVPPGLSGEAKQQYLDGWVAIMYAADVLNLLFVAAEAATADKRRARRDLRSIADAVKDQTRIERCLTFIAHGLLALNGDTPGSDHVRHGLAVHFPIPAMEQPFLENAFKAFALGISSGRVATGQVLYAMSPATYLSWHSFVILLGREEADRLALFDPHALFDPDEAELGRERLERLMSIAWAEPSHNYRESLVAGKREAKAVSERAHPPRK
jgi:hypothetical protein